MAVYKEENGKLIVVRPDVGIAEQTEVINEKKKELDIPITSCVQEIQNFSLPEE